MNAEKELSGRVALVTGASQNIGRAIAESLAAAGASVVVNARRSREAAAATVQAIEQAGGEALAHLADVTDPQAVEGMVAAALARFGRLDILINNAALREEAPFVQLGFDDWRRVVGVILDGAFLCARACVPAIVRAGGGTIINIGGLTGHTGAPQRAHVVAAKAGVAGLTKALAFELAAHRITVNCVSPGLIDTARTGAAPAHHAQRKNLVGRMGGSNEVAAMVRMLCGPDARYITGQTIHVNGGAYLG